MSIKSELEGGSWAVRTLADRFQQSLSRKLAAHTIGRSLTELCLAFYRRLDLKTIHLSAPGKGLRDCLKNDRPLLAAEIEAVISDENPGAELLLFSSEEVEKIEGALSLICDVDPELYTLIDESISAFLRFGSVKFRSASHPHLFGSILIGDGIQAQTDENVAISIIHEFAHQELFLLNLVDRLVNKEFDSHEIHAPFQGRARPPIGRLHSLWALYRMVQYQKISGSMNETYKELLVSNAQSFEDGELTEVAKALVSIALRAAV